MRLKRKTSSILAVVIIVAFFVIAQLTAPSNSIKKDDHSKPPEITPAEGTKAGTSFELHEFHRNEVRDGKKIWEIKAKSGALNPLDQSILLREATIWSYRKEGKVMILTAQQARLHISGQSLTSAEMSSGVRCEVDTDLVILTDAATFEQDSQRVLAPGAVEIESKLFKTTGNNAIFDLEKSDLAFEAGVVSVFQASRK